MKTVFISKNEKTITELLRQAAQQNLILRFPDGHEFVLAEVDDFDREIELARQNDKLMAYLDERAGERATIPLDDNNKELRLFSTKLRSKKESP
jgi:hypothetical protein